MFSKLRLSIDIRDHIVKVVEGKLVDKITIKINKAAYLDIKSIVFGEDSLKKCINDGRLTNCGENVEAIKSFIRKNKFSTDKVILNITDNKVITRIIKLPKLPLNDLDSLVNIEAPKHFPVVLNSFYVDYRILSTIHENDRDYYKILLCAIPKEIIREYTDLLIGSGLKPILIDIHSNSVSRIFKNLEFKDVAVIDGSVESVDLIILQRGIFYVITTFPFKLINYLDLYRDPLQYDISILKGEISNLIRNVQNYINFYLSKNEDKSIDEIYITGDIALIQGIEDVFERELKIKVIKGLDKLVEIKKSNRYLNFNEDFYNGNIGILLRGV